jgi:hypothetical protein
MPKNHFIDEEENVYERIKDNDVMEGDTIELISNNQQGYKKYKVVNNLGEKDVELISTYDDMDGGRRKTRKRNSKKSKRKSKKSKRKSKKSKRKSSKRRSHKRKM